MDREEGHWQQYEEDSVRLQFQTIGIARLRMDSDGEGVTTLAAGYGCPLRCRYCLNPQCFSSRGALRSYSVQELLQEISIDDLYFQATGGGVVFGGGEPLLQAEFIHAFCESCPAQWKIGLETSLAADRKLLQMVEKDIDYYLIDIKDMNPEIYQAYTGIRQDRMLENLRYLAERTEPAKLCIRVPLIEGYNTAEDQKRSVEQLKLFGLTRFDLFCYSVQKAKEKKQQIHE